MLRGRVISTRYEYDDQGRILRSWQDQTYTREDYALLMGLEEYEANLCPGCGHPKDRAWHPDMEGWYEKGRTFTCAACTALSEDEKGNTHEVTFDTVADVRDDHQHPLPPWPEWRPADT